MNEITYKVPGLDAWTLKVSGHNAMLWHKGGAGVSITNPIKVEEIAERVKSILRQSVWFPDEVAEKAADDAVRNVNWTLILDPAVLLFAPLLNAVPPAEVQKADNPALVNEIYTLVKKLADKYT